MKRIYSIDFMRGFVMIIMAIDHVRDMMHVHSITQSPTNLETTTPALFFTRWITYLCAPVFVFLAGTSAYLSFKKNNDLSKTRKYLLTRGIYLVLLEFTIVNFGLFFDLNFHNFIFEVIAAIGFGFIILSFILKASLKTIAIFGLAIIFCHDLFSFIPPGTGILYKCIAPLFNLTVYPLSRLVIIIAYPPIPWVGIMLAGFASGKFFELPVAERKRLFLRISGIALAFFLIVRFINIYGDPVVWSSQKNAIYSFLSFMNITKYPPSLLFTLVTLGIMFFILSFAEGIKGRVVNVVSVYGKVPLFYFVLHFYIIHLLLIVLMYVQGFHWSQMDFASGSFGRPKGMQSGLPLWMIYVVWISVVSILYKPCVWFAHYKATHRQWWLKYV